MSQSLIILSRTTAVDLMAWLAKAAWTNGFFPGPVCGQIETLALC